ncbi:PP0621 family protein [Pseudomonas borbori]
MGLLRLLFWIALIAAAFWLWRRFTRAPQKRDSAESATLPMVRCEQCGVHLPREHALPQADRWYCSQAHLEQDTKHP